MVVNYDLPLMSERDKNRYGSNNDKPDLETYIHRIGTYLSRYSDCDVR